MGSNTGHKIIESWHKNADSWTAALQTNAFESRVLTTNAAILETVLNCGASRILDVGCGEGWLSHKLMDQGKEVVGFDVSASLIEEARKSRSGSSFNAEAFRVLSYDEFAAHPTTIGRDFDVAVCNFSLLDEDLNRILSAMHEVTNNSGHLVIQTLHPCSVVGDATYEDGWREERFDGLPGQWSPMPWYFRTVGSWVRELSSAAWTVENLIEPLHPRTGKPASLILHGRKLFR